MRARKRVSSQPSTALDRIRYDADCFTVDEKDIFLFSGAVHYFRLPRPLWEDCLLKVKRASFPVLETYVPWNWHEKREGKVDLEDLEAYLALAERMGFLLIVRPGPYICSEWDIGGFPRWLPQKRFPFRTDHPESIRWSEHWYASVMPLIARHQITKGGRVILVQLENEYDYSGLPEEVMHRYLTALYHAARRYGIEVPLFTCWTRVARRNEDPVMADIFDTCNFYTGWNFEWTADALAKLRAEEPNSPLMVTELQGGWFSQFGDTLLPHQRDDLTAKQCNALTKFLIANGLSALNYYMLFGGTNFGYWGARHITTTYDYAAPIREPRGLWDKYYAVKLIGDALRSFGSDLARAKPSHDCAQSDNESVKVFARLHEDHGYLFLWNPTDEWQRAKVSVRLPNGETLTSSEPVVLPPRDAKMLPVNLSVGPYKVRLTTLEIQSVVRVGDRWVVVLYGDLVTEGTPYQVQLAGDVDLRGYLKRCDELKLVAEDLMLIITTRQRAERTWRLEPADLPALEMLKPDTHDGIVVSDAYLLRDMQKTEESIETIWEVLPGTTHFLALLPQLPNSVKVDGAPTKVEVDPSTKAVHWTVETEPIPVEPVFSEGLKWRSETVSAEDGKKVKQVRNACPLVFLAPLDDMGWFDNGFYRYETSFTWDKEDETMLLVTYAPDPKLVLLNGRIVAEASNSFRSVSIPLRMYARRGRNVLTVLYEQPGRPNGGKDMNELKGIAGATLIRGGTKELKEWRMSKTEKIAGDSPEIQPDFDDSRWAIVPVGQGYQPELGARERAWFRIRFQLNHIPSDLLLLFEGVDDNAWVWLNGQKVGEHHGWDEPFILPIAHAARLGNNVLVVGVENQEGPGGIYAPVRLLTASDLKPVKDWKVAKGLMGEKKKWQISKMVDRNWRRLALGQRPPAREGSVIWYRTRFTLPETKDYSIPWRLVLHASGDGNIWLNGIHIGRYQEGGPQREFYLPECWLHPNKENILTIALWSSEGIPTITTLRIEPYDEFATKRLRISFVYGEAE